MNYHPTTNLIACQRESFNIPEDVSYLNCAYMSPLSKQVLEVGQEAMLQKMQPYRITVKDFFQPVENLKSAFARLINAKDPQRVVVIPSASYGLATVVNNLKVSPGQNIVTLHEQFPSNIYCWRRLCAENNLELRTIKAPDRSHSRGRDWNTSLLEAIDSQTAVVAIGNVHWADGTVFDLLALRKRTSEVGALLILDGTQAVGAMPFDVTQVQPDALVCAAYKWLMGPYSIGMAYFGSAFDGGVPLEESWINRIGSDDFSALVNYEDQYLPAAVRYDMGEKSNFFLLPMLKASIEQISKWGTVNIQGYCQSIAKSCIEQLKALGFFVEEPAYRANHIFGIRAPDHVNLKTVEKALKDQQVHVSIRGDAIRVSPHVYNTSHDLKKLTDCLAQGIT